MLRKDNLFKEMNDDIDGIFFKIESFRETMEEILNEGLVPADFTKEAKMFAAQGLSEDSATVSNSEDGESEESARLPKTKPPGNELPPIP